MSTLYVVGTPIGNLEDITLRALRVLREVSLVAAEDTRTTRKLLSHFEIDSPLTSYHDHNKLSKLSSIVDALERGDVALVSDAGTPGVNDPGAELVIAVTEAGHEVVPIPGPSAVTSALSIAGIPIEQFVYLGFLPRRSSARRKLFDSVVNEERVLIAFETPHRVVGALTDAKDALGDRSIVICRELTKMHEEIFRGSVSDALDHFTEPRGEFTLIIDGASAASELDESAAVQAKAILREELSRGHGSKDAMAAATATTGLSKNDLYRLWLDISRDQSEARP
jgi:16S rRNA (cytidine1402-2'-O)-methyltransferase